ncbi:hypothetical protein [Thalassobellus sediminis]|uniref:hypothetical protein n=1 Tax=Thalassobellus sediminis TaxID=3367753 RepID=UPI00379F1194
MNKVRTSYLIIIVKCFVGLLVGVLCYYIYNYRIVNERLKTVIVTVENIKCQDISENGYKSDLKVNYKDCIYTLKTNWVICESVKSKDTIILYFDEVDNKMYSINEFFYYH